MLQVLHGVYVASTEHRPEGKQRRDKANKRLLLGQGGPVEVKLEEWPAGGESHRTCILAIVPRGSLLILSTSAEVRIATKAEGDSGPSQPIVGPGAGLSLSAVAAWRDHAREQHAAWKAAKLTTTRAKSPMFINPVPR